MFVTNVSDNVKTEKNLNGYMFIWIGQSISLLGSSVIQFAIIWWITVKTGSPLILSLAMFVGFLPMLLFSPVAGVITDRWNIKAILILSDILQAFATIGLILLFFLNFVEIWHVLILLAIRGTCQAFQKPGNLSIIPLMVPKEKISKINALNSLLNSLIYMASPGFGAMLLVFFSMRDILWLDVFTFIPAAIVLILVFIPGVKRNKTESELQSFKEEFKEGILYVKNSQILPLVIIGTVFNVFANPLFSLLPLIIMQVHSGGSTEFAFIEIMFYIGLFAGSMLMIIRNYLPKVNIWTTCIFLLLLTLMSIALVPAGNMLLLGGLMLFSGIIVSLIDIQFLSLLQITVPTELQGRVYSTVFMIIKSIYTFTLVIIGVLAEVIGFRELFIINPLIAATIILVMIIKTGILKMNNENMQSTVEVPETNIRSSVN
ncbi:MAG: MFS transporter [Candidatus Hodarchaeales archaeon]|jgi:DHA3 family macrolide efflux protein-like MFS transporter